MKGAIFVERQKAFILFTCLLLAFLSVLHMYESFGWWRRADYLKVHFAESWNELHHLLIMEVLLSQISIYVVEIEFSFQGTRCKFLSKLLLHQALGGDERWFDRFLAQHIAVAYFFLTASMYMVSPRMAC